jgi:hypothetical protein
MIVLSIYQLSIVAFMSFITGVVIGAGSLVWSMADESKGKK